jgi:hypothetical protein
MSDSLERQYERDAKKALARLQEGISAMLERYSPGDPLRREKTGGKRKGKKSKRL